MRSSTYRILIDSSYDNLPTEAKQYVNRLVSKAFEKSFVLKVLKGYNDIAVKTRDINVLLSGAFIDSDLNRRVGCSWYLKTEIFLFVFSLLTGVAIPKLLKKNFCLFLQSLIIASYCVKEDIIIPYYWDYE